jgi:hypothetical protein
MRLHFFHNDRKRTIVFPKINSTQYLPLLAMNIHPLPLNNQLQLLNMSRILPTQSRQKHPRGTRLNESGTEKTPIISDT